MTCLHPKRLYCEFTASSLRVLGSFIPRGIKHQTFIMRSKNKIYNATWPTEYSSPSIYRYPLVLEICRHKFDNYIKYTFPMSPPKTQYKEKVLNDGYHLAQNSSLIILLLLIHKWDMTILTWWYLEMTNGYLAQHSSYHTTTRIDSRLPIFTTKNVNFQVMSRNPHWTLYHT